jgi:hypothetical protein
MLTHIVTIDQGDSYQINLDLANANVGEAPIFEAYDNGVLQVSQSGLVELSAEAKSGQVGSVTIYNSDNEYLDVMFFLVGQVSNNPQTVQGTSVAIDMHPAYLQFSVLADPGTTVYIQDETLQNVVEGTNSSESLNFVRMPLISAGSAKFLVRTVNGNVTTQPIDPRKPRTYGSSTVF